MINLSWHNAIAADSAAPQQRTAAIAPAHPAGSFLAVLLCIRCVILQYYLRGQGIVSGIATLPSCKLLLATSGGVLLRGLGAALLLQ